MKISTQIVSIITLFVMLGCSKDNANNNVNTTVTDVDGNVYPTVVIGTQTWTQTNLNVSHYRNGDVIPQVTDPTAWANLTTGAWCYYNNDPANGAIYGKLYNWYAVNDPRGLAAKGYHVPTVLEWTTLIEYLGGKDVAGGKMKSPGTSLWLSPNTGATNSSGFTGLPGGNNDLGKFYFLRKGGYWWSSSEINNVEYRSANIRALTTVSNYITTGQASKAYTGMSIRCIKD